MAINRDMVNKVLYELEQLKFFHGVNRFPAKFYTKLNDQERAEVIRLYRSRNGIGNNPQKKWDEEKA